MLNNKKEAESESDGLTVRQRLRQKRELEEKRKFGLAPLAVDAVSGNEISPNVPQFIAQAPWYYGVSGSTLEHQRHRTNEAMDRLQDSEDRTVVVGKAKNFVAGACANCGSRTHQTTACYKPRRRVGAVHSGKVTGVDLEVTRAEKNYAQKRDRYVTGAGVDLLQMAAPDATEGGDDAGKAAKSAHSSEVLPNQTGDGEPMTKRTRLADPFAQRTAVTGGGTAIKELPKYLHNLDDGGSFFDPKTGSMRGNPNAADPTRTFQGDLERYRSGDYYVYLEMQHRFLKGDSASIVDFKLDKQLQTAARRQQEAAEGIKANVPKPDKASVAQEKLVRSLYGASAPATTEGVEKMKEAFAAATTATTTGKREDAEQNASQMAPTRWADATRNGHPCVYGSYFDRKAWAWGYKCCQCVGKEAKACLTTQNTE